MRALALLALPVLVSATPIDSGEVTVAVSGPSA